MAGNSFNITISATDRATASIKKVNDSISKLTRPFENVQKSMNSVGRELAKNPVVKGLASIEQAAMGVAGSIAKIGAPLAALVGVGSIAGINALVTGWGRMGFELTTTSASIGVSTQALQAWRGAAQLAGVSSEAVTGSLGALGTTLQDAAFGRNAPARDMMRLIGLEMYKTSTGAIDTSRAMLDLSKILTSPAFAGKAQEQGLIARVFGSEASLPMLREGPAAIRAGMKEYERLNPYIDPEKAAAYAKQIFRMGAAFDGMKNTIGSSLIPVMQPLLEQFTNWVQLNQKPIGENLGKWVSKMADYIQTIDFEKVVANIGTIGTAITKVAEGAVFLIDKLDKLGTRESSQYLNTDWVGESLASPGAAMPAGTSTAGGGRGRLEGNWGMHYNDPALNAYANLVEQRNGLPRNMLNGIKNFGEKSDPGAVSPKGARGVMQFMPGTWAQYGKGDPSNPYASIDAAGAYVKDMMKRYSGSVPASLTEYNGGIAQARAVQSGGQPWAAETQHYISRVQSGMATMNSSTDVNVSLQVSGLPSGASVTAKSTDTGKNIPVQTRSPMPSFGG
jgi:hypothetical protein